MPAPAQSSAKPVSVLTKTTGTYYGNSNVTPLERDVQLSVAEDLYSTVIGPTPMAVFLDKLVPASGNPMGKIKSDFFNSIPTTGKEVDVYPHFVSSRLPQQLS